MGILRKIIKDITKPMVTNIRGKQGELKVKAKLNPLIFGRVNHRLINNLIIVDDRGKSHQIDHIDIRENGIFCIETKNYIGYIFGTEMQNNWTQTLYNGETYQLINPIKQNKSHIYHLNKILDNKYKINSVIVMVQNNADKINISYVLNLDDLKNYLKNFNDGTHLTNLEMDEIKKKFLNSAIRMSNREHIKNIAKTQNEIEKGICPRCGGKLVEREGKYGRFLGCSNYPRCKFILKNKSNYSSY